MPHSKQYTAQLHAAAVAIVREFGIKKLDAMENPARSAQLTVFRVQLQQETGCTRETARQHIAKACRRLRDPNFVMPQWGGAWTKNS